ALLHRLQLPRHRRDPEAAGEDGEVAPVLGTATAKEPPAAARHFSRMSDDRINALLGVAAGRELSDEEQAELEQLLNASPEAERRFRLELERVEATLRKIPQLAPPQALHDRIMASVSLPMVKAEPRARQA